MSVLSDPKAKMVTHVPVDNIVQGRGLFNDVETKAKLES